MSYGAISTRSQDRNSSSLATVPNNSRAIDFEIEQDLYQCEETKELLDIQPETQYQNEEEFNFQDHGNELSFDKGHDKQNRYLKSNDELRDTIDTLEKAKLVAHQISDDLCRDREILDSSNRKMLDSRNQAMRAKQVLHSISRRAALNKAFLIFIILLLSFIDCFLFYRLITNKGRL